MEVIPSVVAEYIVSDTLVYLPDAYVQFTDASEHAEYWIWDFGDGATSNIQDPEHTYTNQGYYTVSLIVGNSCSIDSIAYDDLIHVDFPININKAVAAEQNVSAFPNPITNGNMLQIVSKESDIIRVSLASVSGQIISRNFTQYKTTVGFPIDNLSPGIYVLTVTTKTSEHSLKINTSVRQNYLI